MQDLSDYHLPKCLSHDTNLNRLSADIVTKSLHRICLFNIIYTTKNCTLSPKETPTDKRSVWNLHLTWIVWKRPRRKRQRQQSHLEPQSLSDWLSRRAAPGSESEEEASGHIQSSRSWTPTSVWHTGLTDQLQLSSLWIPLIPLESVVKPEWATLQTQD